MLKLDESAAIDAAVQSALDLVPAEARKDQWSRQTNDVKAFKSAVKDHGMHVQSAKCVWCESKIGFTGRRSAQRDHIAPKDLYSRWTFEADNIALSCEYCNGFEVKKTLDTIEVIAADYGDCSFRIVHPYFDDPAVHIGFVLENQRVVMRGLSPKGIWTIGNMKLDSPSSTASRALDVVLEDAALPEHLAILVRQALEAL
jgi:hypothetical protein